MVFNFNISDVQENCLKCGIYDLDIQVEYVEEVEDDSMQSRFL